MITLGIETSCDETSVSVSSGYRVLSNVISSSVHLHKKYGGVVPEIASRYHVEYIIEVLDRALQGSGKSLEDIDLISVTNGPGLVGALLIGVSLAKSLSLSLDIPLIGVNHILAHLYSSLISGSPSFPFIGLVVSGGHTTIFYCEDLDKYKLLGQTQDDAVGEAFDKVAKILGLGYPGGPAIEKRARAAKRTNKIVFPKSYLGEGSLDFSYSGIKTSVLNFVRAAERRAGEAGKLDDDLIDDIACSFQEAALDVLVDKALLAVKKKGLRRLVVGGGVAINGRLREKCEAACKKAGIDLYFPDRLYCTDNAAMVGVLGEAMYKKGDRADLSLKADPNLDI